MRTTKRLALMLCLVMALSLLLPAGLSVAKAAPQLRMYNVWATWCGPCVREIPALGRIARDYAGRVEVIGLQLDGDSDSGWEKGKTLFANSNATYTNLVPTSSHDIYTDVEFVPTTHFVNSRGDIIETIVGGYDYSGWKRIIDKLLKNLPIITSGDANNDKKVDILDLVSIIDYIVSGTECKSMANADANNDKLVDILDLVWIIDVIVGA